MARQADKAKGTLAKGLDLGYCRLADSFKNCLFEGRCYFMPEIVGNCLTGLRRCIMVGSIGCCRGLCC